MTISSALNLSKRMGGKARLLADAIEDALSQDEKNNINQESETKNYILKQRLAVSRYALIRDVSPKDFADIIAQTITHGMFTAWLYGGGLLNFSKITAAELIPESHLHLKKLFQYLASDDIDNRITSAVDAVVDVLIAVDLSTFFEDLEKITRQNNPAIYYYENFLNEYDPKLRKSQADSYLTEPIVRFIMQAVDDFMASNKSG